MQNIVIIGGGAAGMMAAATLAEGNTDAKLTLIERNPGLGHKVIISGGGRCNVTTGLRDNKKLLTNYPRGSKFLKSALYNFSPQHTYEWMEAHGVPLKTEADLRVFPQSNNGKDIVGIFKRLLNKHHVTIKLKSTVTNISKNKNFTIHLKDQPPIQADKVILCVGGQAYRHTGSKGDGYSFAEGLGHSITKLGPGLSALMTHQNWSKELAGLAFPVAKLKLHGEEKHEFTGPILFTHKGLSGPGIFALSSLAAYETISKQETKEISIDFFPNKNYEQMSTFFLQKAQEEAKKHVHNTLAQLTPKSFAKALCQLHQISPELTNAELTKKQRKALIESLKNTTLTVTGRLPGDEFVTTGGVELSEVNPKTMESKLCPGLFFAGEILNQDGFTGGFNLQAAWATGRLAGQNALS